MIEICSISGIRRLGVIMRIKFFLGADWVLNKIVLEMSYFFIKASLCGTPIKWWGNSKHH